MKEFKTREDAEKELEENLADYTYKQEQEFCPLINAKCKTTCVCFCSPIVLCSKYDATMHIREASCGNAMFTGERYCHQ